MIITIRERLLTGGFDNNKAAKEFAKLYVYHSTERERNTIDRYLRRFMSIKGMDIISACELLYRLKTHFMENYNGLPPKKHNIKSGRLFQKTLALEVSKPVLLSPHTSDGYRRVR